MNENLADLSIEELVEMTQNLGREVDALQEKRSTIMNVLNEKVRRKDVLNRANLTTPLPPTSVRSEVR